MTLEFMSLAILKKPGNAKVIWASGHYALQWRLGRLQEHHTYCPYSIAVAKRTMFDWPRLC